MQRNKIKYHLFSPIIKHNNYTKLWVWEHEQLRLAQSHSRGDNFPPIEIQFNLVSWTTLQFLINRLTQRCLKPWNLPTYLQKLSTFISKSPQLDYQKEIKLCNLLRLDPILNSSIGSFSHLKQFRKMPPMFIGFTEASTESFAEMEWDSQLAQSVKHYFVSIYNLIFKSISHFVFLNMLSVNNQNDYILF